MERALLKGLGSLGFDAGRLLRAYGRETRHANGKLAPWFAFLGDFCLLVDKGWLESRDLLRVQDDLVPKYLIAATLDVEFGERDEEARLMAVKKDGGGWHAGPLGPYAERWQAVAVGWAWAFSQLREYGEISWPAAKELTDSMARRCGFGNRTRCTVEKEGLR